jgi:hypothetical protein
MKQIIVARKSYRRNRSERKKIEKEYNRNIVDFDCMEKDFIYSLYDEQGGIGGHAQYDYRACYNFTLDWWNKTIARMDDIRAFKLTKLNEHYFEELYKPMEDPYVLTRLDTLLGRVRALSVSEEGNVLVLED